jgi:hypothetical protein
VVNKTREIRNSLSKNLAKFGYCAAFNLITRVKNNRTWWENFIILKIYNNNKNAIISYRIYK